MTNNVAEYYGLIAAMDYAQSPQYSGTAHRERFRTLGEADARQYKVKSEDLRPLFERRPRKCHKRFDSFRIEHVYREQNREADALANEALDETEGRAPSPPPAKKTEPSDSKLEPRRIQARFRGGVLYLLEDVELPDGMVVDVSIHVASQALGLRFLLSMNLPRDYFSA